ncbi:GIY-YIG nuclease family protein [Candidatus Amoebophilus asiaticus]|nr:GIY-YIG nuclease family protein [Candidatus Amoebophilus asiaticus]
MFNSYYVYILTNRNNHVLYTGVTNDIVRRVYEHKNKLIKGFTNRYNVNKLVWLEEYNDVFATIEREKQIKAGSRKSKLDLINQGNPDWKDLNNELMET